MATTKKGLTARIAAGLGAAALATLTALGGALPATAAEPGNLNEDTERALTIHKFAEPETATELPNDGSPLTEQQLASLDGLEGVEFTVRLVPGIDLTTNEGWASATALTLAQAQALVAAETPSSSNSWTGTTDANGQLELPDMPLGVFLVTEGATGGNPIAIKAAPFLVTLPLPLDSGWLYDVHVYPKNSLTAIDKDLDDDAAFGLGDAVEWTIEVDVPEVAADDQLDEFVISDSIDPRLSLVSATVSATEGGVPVTLTQDVHYEVATSPTYTVTFTQAGRDLLETLDDATVTVEIVTNVVSLEGDDTTEDGEIVNVAVLTVNGSTFETAPVQTNWGTLTILKHATGDESNVLAGAQFQVFTSLAAAQARSGAVSVTYLGTTSDTFTSNADGIAFVGGLKAGTYWIVETAAPVGYTATATPIEVVVSTGDLSQATIEAKVPNAQVPAYELPVTGGAGQMAFMLGGFGLVALALGFALLRRRSAQQQD